MSNLPVEYKENIFKRFFHFIKRFLAIEEVEVIEEPKEEVENISEKLTYNEILIQTEDQERAGRRGRERER